MKVKIVGTATTTVLRVVEMDDAEFQELRARLDDGDRDASQEVMEAADWDRFDDAEFEIEDFCAVPNP